MTTAGSLALEGSIAARDAFVVERLRAAGAVILGKTNLSEWANIRSTKSSSGWSGRGGQTKNPYALDRNPCGSSSGTGSAIAANLAAVGVGTETDGSIVCPSSVAGLVGIKPTVGLVSRSGIIPISHSQDTAGPMTRTVTDAAVLLTAMTGVDARDIATKASAGRAVDYAKGTRPWSAQGSAHRRGSQAVLRVQPRRRSVDRRGHCRDEGEGCDHSRPRGHPDRVDARGLRARHPALRVQGRFERLSGRSRSIGEGQVAGGRDRVQRAREGARDAVLRPGTVRDGREEGPVDVARVPPGARHVPIAGAGARHRCGHVAPSLGRDRGTDGKPRLADRSPERRSLPRRELHAGGRGRLSEHHRARWRRARVTGGSGVHGPQVERAQAHCARLRFRAGDQAPSAAEVPALPSRCRDGVGLLRVFLQNLSYQARIRCSKSTLSAPVLGGRWPPFT